MRNKQIVIGSVLFLGILVAFFFYKTNTRSPNASTTPIDQPKVKTDNVKEFQISGKNFSFTPSQIQVKRGDLVRIIFNNTEGFHDLRIDNYNVGTNQFPASKSATFAFTADKLGSFEFYCSVGAHRQMGMKGILLVEE